VQLGDLIQALPGVYLVARGDPTPGDGWRNDVEIYSAGDEGTVMGFPTTGRKQQTYIEVMWARSGLKSVEEGLQQRFRFLRRQTLAVGDLLQALPGRNCVIDGKDICRSGDVATLSRFISAKGAKCGEFIEVVCARTGKLCSVEKHAWMSVFRVVRHQVLEAGDLLEVLPGVGLDDHDGAEARARRARAAERSSSPLRGVVFPLSDLGRV